VREGEKKNFWPFVAAMGKKKGRGARGRCGQREEKFSNTSLQWEKKRGEKSGLLLRSKGKNGAQEELFYTVKKGKKEESRFCSRDGKGRKARLYLLIEGGRKEGGRGIGHPIHSQQRKERRKEINVPSYSFSDCGARGRKEGGGRGSGLFSSYAHIEQ